MQKARTLTCLIAAIAILLPCAKAQTIPPKSKPKLSSVYTQLKDCKLRLELTGREGGDPYATCKPVGGYIVHIAYNATLVTVSIWDSTGKKVTELGTDYIAIGMQREAVEWRMAAGQPFAVIYKIGRFDTTGYSAGNPYKAFNLKGYDWVAKGLRGCEAIDFVMEVKGPETATAIRRRVDEAYIR